MGSDTNGLRIHAGGTGPWALTQKLATFSLTEARETVVDQDQADQYMEDREAEKLADLEALADSLAAFRQIRRELDQWERVHFARGLAAVFSGCYGTGALEAAIALTPVDERSPSERVPADPFYQRLDLALFERALSDVWAEPARRVPYIGPIDIG
jgi:hypothetical protein